MTKISEFITKSGKKIGIVLPEMKFLSQITDFVNRLAKEDTFLSFVPKKEISKKEEKIWLKNTIHNIKIGKTFSAWAIYENKIVGTCDCIRGGTRDPHVGTIGLMVDQDFRRDGIGKFLLEFVIKNAEKMNFKIVQLNLFSDNEIALKLYEKEGFKIYGRLPKGVVRKNIYTDLLWMYKNL
jgi:RimJ/RimL family protein N-acetyltransferase